MQPVWSLRQRILTELLPIATAKDSSLYVTQYEGEVIESAGVIKMDFLGLRTLSIIKNRIESDPAKSSSGN